MPGQPYVTGAAPVTYISEASSSAGKQYQIPLCALGVTSNQPDASPWFTATGNSADQSLVEALLISLTQQGLLTVVTPSS